LGSPGLQFLRFAEIVTILRHTPALATDEARPGYNPFDLFEVALDFFFVPLANVFRFLCHVDCSSLQMLEYDNLPARPEQNKHRLNFTRIRELLDEIYICAHLTNSRICVAAGIG
jgi:hypothetical protein